MSLYARSAGLLAAILAAALAGPTRAQVIIVDRRPNIPIARSYEVKEVAVDAKIRDQAAEVQISQTFHNPGSVPLEAEFLFPLPEDGAISNLVLLADGQELTGKLLPKDEARKIYEDIVRSKRDPALLEYMGRGLYRTSVFPIPAGADRKVTMRYTQLLKRDGKVVEFSYPFGTQKFTAKPIQRLELRARIDSKEAIKSVYSPTDDAAVKRIGEHEATVELIRRDVIPTADFRVLYTLDEGAVGASVLSYRPSSGEDGYFLVLASPEFKAAESKPRPKTVVFVLDRSGSMAGKKIEQARESLKFCLNNLRDDDTFNIIAYDDRVESFKPELQRYDRDRRDEAVRFVDNIRPGGSTNINDALTTALGMLHDDGRPQYVLFLTDGLPTAGVTGEAAIADNVRKANKFKTRVFVFGVGFDVNARLLDRISGGNSGTSEYVKPDENIEAKVGRFYTKLTAPVLAGIQVELSGTDTNRVYPRDVPDLFEGGQLTLVGRYTKSGRSTVRLSGKVGDERRTFEFPAELAEAGKNASYDFVERLWAVRRVGQIIDQIDLNGQNKELTDELVELSKKYGILTPYTSFLADEGVRLHDRVANLNRATRSLDSCT
ncbi:MAG: VIT domain-containing protein [Isosphaeraceae bacterium]